MIMTKEEAIEYCYKYKNEFLSDAYGAQAKTE